MDLQRLLSQMANYTNDAIIITRADHLENPGPEIVYVNRAFTQITGYMPHEVIGKNPRILQGPDTDKETLRRIREAIAWKKPIVAELINYSRDGSPYWIEISINPVSNEAGDCSFFVAVERDITERKTAEINLIKSRDEAEAATKAKSDFLANMSHELRTPMNGILGLAELMCGMPLDNEQRECITAIHNSGSALLNILNDILDLSKIEAGEIELDPRPFQVKRMLQKVRDLTSHLASRKGLKYDINLGLDVPDWLRGDDNRLQQVLFNLVSNAIKFTEQGSVVLDVDLKRVAGKALTIVRVTDTGIGIPDNFQDRLYSKFSQADSSITRKFGGTGLGLAITRTLVELMDGTITFESKEGQGTTFIITLPIEELTDKETAKLSNPGAIQNTLREKTLADLTGRNLSDVRLLVVEDHPVNTMLVAKWLNKLGLTQIDCVENGFESLSYLRHKDYNAVLMDCQMPELDGFETTSLIRDMEKNQMHRTPIIAMTANAMMGEREKCIAAGMDDYMSKPLQFERLKETLAYWLKPKSTATVQDMAHYIPARQELIFEENALDIEDDAPPVDMSRMQEFTDGDHDVLESLIKLFTDNSVPLLNVMASECIEGPSEEWRKASHTLKGAAGNLGAMRLHKLAIKAERMFDKNKAVKEHILQLLRDEYARVDDFLTKV